MATYDYGVARLKELAWLEYRVTKQFKRVTHTDDIIDPAERSAGWRWAETVEMPPGFVAVELGMGFNCGPSIIWTLMNLGKQNRRRNAQMNAKLTKQRKRNG